jgi:capsular exopolysaccharide synthesis family protein
MRNDQLLSSGSDNEIIRQGGDQALSCGRSQWERVREFSFSRESETGGLLRYWQVLRRYKGTLILTALLCSAAAFVVSRLQTPVYESSTSLEIQGFNDPSLIMTALESNPRASEALMDSYIQTQIEILGSGWLIGRVIEQQGLEKRSEFIEKPGRLRALRKYLWLPARPLEPAREHALAIVRENLRVTAPHGSHLIKIQYSSADPKLAANFPNALAQEFIDQNLELRLRSTQHTTEWLNRQLEDLKDKLRDSEVRLQTYGHASGLMFTSENDSVAEARLKQLQDELSRAQADRMAKQSRFELVKRTPADSLPDVLDSSPLRDYQVKLTDLRQQLAEKGSLLAPSHYKVKELRAQIAEVESALESERAHITERVANSYESAKRREQLLSEAYARQSALKSQQDVKGVQYRILKQEVDSTRRLYEVMLEKVHESSMASAMRVSNIVVFDPAVEPSHPYKPNLLLSCSLGLLSGIFMGVVLVFIRESADRSLRAGDSLMYLKVPELGVIPAADSDSSLSRGLGIRLPEKGQGSVELATWRRTWSPLAESFRAALVSILFTGANGSGPRVIVLTSSGSGEGKTTSVTNLGTALARVRRRVLLIDGDMRRPRLHTIFSLPNHFGLSNLLADSDLPPEQSIEKLHDCLAMRSAVQKTEIPGLFVLTSGSPTVISPCDLMYSPRLAELVRRLREEFDAVLIDTPPMLRLADARILGRLADAVILVCRAGATDRDSALAATQQFAADGTPVLGTILNDWKPDTDGTYGYYGSNGNFEG